MTTDETGQTLDYDAWGRIVEINTDGAGTTEVTYAYDSLNRRIDHNGNYLYYSEQWQVLEERDAQGVESQHVWSPVYVDAMVLRDRDSDNDGTMEATDERLYVVHDANFNVTAVADASGVVLERYVYDPYGERTVLDPTWAADADGTSDYGFEHGHQGGWHDQRIGLVHFRLRDLDTSLGRWTEHDPASYIEGANLYLAYRSNAPRWVDPDGLQSGPTTLPTAECEAPRTDDYKVRYVGRELLDFWGYIRPAWDMNIFDWSPRYGTCTFQIGTRQWIDLCIAGKNLAGEDDDAVLIPKVAKIDRWRIPYGHEWGDGTMKEGLACRQRIRCKYEATWTDCDGVLRTYKIELDHMAYGALVFDDLAHWRCDTGFKCPVRPTPGWVHGRPPE